MKKIIIPIVGVLSVLIGYMHASTQTLSLEYPAFFTVGLDNDNTTTSSGEGWVYKSFDAGDLANDRMIIVNEGCKVAFKVTTNMTNLIGVSVERTAGPAISGHATTMALPGFYPRTIGQFPPDKVDSVAYFYDGETGVSHEYNDYNPVTHGHTGAIQFPAFYVVRILGSSPLTSINYDNSFTFTFVQK